MTDPLETRRRWHLVIGSPSDEGRQLSSPREPWLEDQHDREIDRLLQELYQNQGAGGLGQSRPQLVNLFGDLSRHFPDQVRRIMVRDAIEMIGLSHFLEEPQLAAAIEPDPIFVRTLIELMAGISVERRGAVRELIRQIVDRSIRRLRLPLELALRSHLIRTRPIRPTRAGEIDWHRTIRANLRNYQPSLRTIIPSRLIPRPQHQPRRTIIVCVDSSESMASSSFHAALIATIVAAIPSFRTHLVCFDTRVADLTDQLPDPVELLFHLNLAGGTDIGRALNYCQTLATSGTDTVIFLVSDLRDRPTDSQLLPVATRIIQRGIRLVPVVALDDTGRASYDSTVAADLTNLGAVPIVASPDTFPTLLTSYLER